jgi:hypothetical protein
MCLFCSPKLAKRGSITARSDKSDDKKDTSKLAKDTTKTLKAEKSTVNQDKDTKQSKSKKLSRDQSSEKKNDPTTPNKTGGRRMSKADVRGMMIVKSIVGYTSSQAGLAQVSAEVTGKEEALYGLAILFSLELL